MSDCPWLGVGAETATSHCTEVTEKQFAEPGGQASAVLDATFPRGVSET